MFARTRCSSGLTVDCCSAESSRLAGSRGRSLTQKIFVISAIGTVEKSWDTG
jgi:hypothetical protein